MGKKATNINPFATKDYRFINTSLLTYDLPSLVDTMKHKQAWAEGELNAMVLLKSLDKQIVLTALHEGTEIQSFQSNDSVTFQIIEGKLMFHTQKESVALDKGQLLTLHDKINYRLESEEDTVFLLTIATNNLHGLAT